MNYDRDDQRNSKCNGKIIAIKRVSRTVKDGHTMRFSALVIVRDGKGKVGVGLGKASGVPETICEGKEATMKSIVTVTIDENKSTPHSFTGKHGSAVVLMKRTPEGTGIVAGGSVRTVVELAGIQSIRTKSLGSNNKINIVLATLEGLEAIHPPEEIVERRDRSVEDILGWKGRQKHGETA